MMDIISLLDIQALMLLLVLDIWRDSTQVHSIQDGFIVPLKLKILATLFIQELSTKSDHGHIKELLEQLMESKIHIL